MSRGECLTTAITIIKGKLYPTGLNPIEPAQRTRISLLETLDRLEIARQAVIPEIVCDGTPLPKSQEHDQKLLSSIRELASACPRLGRHRTHRNPVKR